jgi:hypothetical protein
MQQVWLNLCNSLKLQLVSRMVVVLTANKFKHFSGPGCNTSAQTLQKRLFHYCCSLIAMETCFFAELLLSSGCSIVACFTVIAKQQVYMPQYK